MCTLVNYLYFAEYIDNAYSKLFQLCILDISELSSFLCTHARMHMHMLGRASSGRGVKFYPGCDTFTTLAMGGWT